MEWSPIRMTYHVRTYQFGERLIPEMLGKQGVPGRRRGRDLGDQRPEGHSGHDHIRPICRPAPARRRRGIPG